MIQATQGLAVVIQATQGLAVVIQATQGLAADDWVVLIWSWHTCTRTSDCNMPLLNFATGHTSDQKKMFLNITRNYFGTRNPNQTRTHTYMRTHTLSLFDASINNNGHFYSAISHRQGWAHHALQGRTTTHPPQNICVKPQKLYTIMLYSSHTMHAHTHTHIR